MNHASDYGKLHECRRGAKSVRSDHDSEVMRPRDGYAVEPWENGAFCLRRYTPQRKEKYGQNNLQEVKAELLAVGTEKEMEIKAAQLIAAENARKKNGKVQR